MEGTMFRVVLSKGSVFHMGTCENNSCRILERDFHASLESRGGSSALTNSHTHARSL